MKTAVKWLEDILWSGKDFDLNQVFKQAKEMEKEQIIEAHEEGFYSPPFRMSRRKEAEQWYNETFKSE
jgi:hypothetical protein